MKNLRIFLALLLVLGVQQPSKVVAQHKPSATFSLLMTISTVVLFAKAMKKVKKKNDPDRVPCMFVAAMAAILTGCSLKDLFKSFVIHNGEKAFAFQYHAALIQ